MMLKEINEHLTQRKDDEMRKSVVLLATGFVLFLVSCENSPTIVVPAEEPAGSAVSTSSPGKPSRMKSSSSTLSAAEAPLLITAPPEGSVLYPGQHVTIQWTGGDPSWSVDVFLTDVTAWTGAYLVAGNVPNSGSVDWTLPPEYPFGGPNGHVYLFYIQNVQVTAWTYGPLFSIVSEIPIHIDVKPNELPNAINPRSKGVVPVAILSTGTFDATTVDGSTVHFGASGVEASAVRSAIEDVNKDGRPDMILHFSTQASGIKCGDSIVFLTGKTLGGQLLRGSDSIITVGCK